MTTPPDPLDPLLNRWTTPAADRPSLTPEVWRRIMAAETSRRGPLSEILACFARPSFAIMFVACCALLGLFIAELRINHQQRERGAQLARSYIQLIDPLLKVDAEARLP